MTNINEQASFWITREKEGFESWEENEFQLWINESPQHKTAFNNIKELRESFLDLPQDSIQQLKSEAKNEARITKFAEQIKPLVAAAVILLTICFAAFEVYNYNEVQYKQTFISKNEKIDNINLSDGSKIVMDVKSKINIHFYKNTREVEFLEGKAIFSIAKDKNRPFIINSGKVNIEVIGTQFEVTKIKDSTSVKVKEGIVKISKINDDKLKTITRLTKGQEIHLNTSNNTFTYGKVDIESIATWEKGYLLFNHTPLKDVMTKFERYTQIEVNYENSEIAHLPIAGKFSIEDFDKFLNALPKIYPVKIEKNNNLIRISQK